MNYGLRRFTLLLTLASVTLSAGRALAYGVIAYSPSTGRYATQVHVNYGIAALDALGDCTATDCRVVTWVDGGCASLAVGTPWTTWGTSYSETIGQARRLRSAIAGSGRAIAASLRAFALTERSANQPTLRSPWSTRAC